MLGHEGGGDGRERGAVLKTPETVSQDAFVGPGFCMRAFVHLHMCVHMLAHACGAQRTAFRSRFSPSAMGSEGQTQGYTGLRAKLSAFTSRAIFLSTTF